MAGYDISASTSYSNAANSAAGPATSGGVSVGNVNVGGGLLSGSGSGLFSPPAPGTPQALIPAALGSGTQGVILAVGGVAVLGFAAWYLLKRKG